MFTASKVSPAKLSPVKLSPLKLSLKLKIFLLVLVPLLVLASLMLLLMSGRHANEYRGLLVRATAQSSSVFGMGVQELMDSSGKPLSSSDIQDSVQMRLMELVALGATPLNFATVYNQDGTLLAAYDSSFQGSSVETSVLRQNFIRLMGPDVKPISAYSQQIGKFEPTAAQVTPPALTKVLGKRETTLTGYPLPGGVGVVVLGLSEQYIRERVLASLAPTALLTLLVVLLTAVGAALFANALIGRIQRLSARVTAISMGELDQPIEADAQDELGELAESVERMRFSLETIMARM
jgi:HAMP domain-containing protein